MRILIIDNNVNPADWGSRELCRHAREFAQSTTGVEIHVRRGPHDDLPADPAGFDRVVISGSATSAMDDAPWIEHLHEFIRRYLGLSRPLLGVCYGHQSLARVLGGKGIVRRAAEAEFGWSRIDVLEPSALTDGLGSSFYSFSSHFDEVAELPPGMRLLARSELCGIQACQLGDLPVFGIQFHPEKNLAEAQKSLAERRKAGTPKRLLHAEESEKYFDPKVGRTIFGNFFKLCPKV